MKVIGGTVLFIAIGPVLLAQSSSPPPANSHGNCPATLSKGEKAGDASCATPSRDPQSVSQQFPYPGESQPAVNSSSVPPSQLPSAAQPSPSAGAAKAFPYPGESSSSSSSDSSSSSSSTSGGDDAAAGDARPRDGVRRKLPKVTKLQSDEEREGEDLDIARFYRQSGNFQAAYLRAKDAVKLQPGDSEAHFALADAAQRVGKKEEAALEFKAYLQMEPKGDRVKAAEKALASMH